jgi:hypothetical protein
MLPEASSTSMMLFSLAAWLVPKPAMESRTAKQSFRVSITMPFIDK